MVCLLVSSLSLAHPDFWSRLASGARTNADPASQGSTSHSVILPSLQSTNHNVVKNDESVVNRSLVGRCNVRDGLQAGFGYTVCLWMSSASLTKSSSLRRCSKHRISGRSAQAMCLLQTGDMTRCWPRVRGSACGTISASVADQSFRNPEKGKLRRRPCRTSKI